MNLITRNYRPDDFLAVESLWKQTGLHNAMRADNNEVILHTIQLGGRLILLENSNNGEMIGTSWLTLDGRRIYLHHFAIKPQHQGKGYAGILLRASIDFAKSTGLQLKLEVHKSNEIARHLYVKGGFKALGDYEVYIIRNYENL